jgi:hypothetical protein
VVALVVLLLVIGALLLAGLRLLRHVRADHDARIAEHWRRNGQERPPRRWL